MVQVNSVAKSPQCSSTYYSLVQSSSEIAPLACICPSPHFTTMYSPGPQSPRPPLQVPLSTTNLIHIHSLSIQSSMFKKVVNIRHKFTRKKAATSSDSVGPPKGTTRSIHVQRNSCMSQPVLGLDITNDHIPHSPGGNDSSRTDSTDNYSPALQSSPITTWNPGVGTALSQGPLRLYKSTSLPVKARPSNDDMPSAGDHVLERLWTPTIVSSSKKTSNKACDAQQVTPKATMTHISPAPPPSSTSGGVSSRRTSVPRIANMPPLAFRINDDGTVRLSPAIITRPSPRPILNLLTLTLPSTSTTVSSRSTHQNANSNSDDHPRRPHDLSSVPALRLSQDGTNRECDHDNLGTDTEEEVYMDIEDEPSPSPRSQRGGSDDEDGDDLAPSRPSQNSWRFLPKGAATPTLRVVGGEERTPAVTGAASNRLVDYFSARSSLGPLPGRPSTPAGNGNALSRPTLYQHASKSMEDILSPKTEVAPDSGTNKGKMPAQAQEGDGGADILNATPAYTRPDSSSGLRRQSMPIFKYTSDPPPYPSFISSHPTSSTPNVQPRDDEGRETLPSYSNSIHLVAIMPRKMEFTAPGIQAKDRKWRRALCELEGTVFRVYRCPPGLVGGGVIGEWWEKRVGVGDAASGSAPGAGPSVKLDQSGRRGASDDGGGERVNKLTEKASKSERRSRTQDGLLAPLPHQNESTTMAYMSRPMRIASNLLHPITRGGSSPAALRAHSRSRSDANPEGEHVPRSLSNISRDGMHSSSRLNSSLVSRSSNLVLPSTSPTSASRSAFALPLTRRHSIRSSPRPEVPLVPDRADLIKAYTLQHAESGLGNDYLKRKNVIRVRSEGEQFLLQAQDVMGVVEWIEVSCRSFSRGMEIGRVLIGDERDFMLLLISRLTWMSALCLKAPCSRGMFRFIFKIIADVVLIRSAIVDDGEEEDGLMLEILRRAQLIYPIDPLRHEAILPCDIHTHVIICATSIIHTTRWVVIHAIQLLFSVLFLPTYLLSYRILLWLLYYIFHRVSF